MGERSTAVLAPSRNRGTLFLFGVGIGAASGLGILLGGGLALIPGVALMTYAVSRQPRFATGSGALIGFGASWAGLLGEVTLRCASDPACAEPDLYGVVAFALGLVAIGVVLGAATWRRFGVSDRTRGPGRDS